MARLDINRQNKLEPERMKYAKEAVEKQGYVIGATTDNWFKFVFKGSDITFFPYSGWATGKTIKDGRGLKGLIKQIKAP